MIDVWGVLANSLWILGLAILLAALSWAHWVANTKKVRLRAVLGRPWAQRVLTLGLILLCAGLAATGRTWWERALWALLAVAWGVSAAGRGPAPAGDERSPGGTGDQLFLLVCGWILLAWLPLLG